MWKWVLGAGLAGTIAYFVFRPKTTVAKDYIGAAIGLPPGLIQPPGISLTLDDVAIMQEAAARNPKDYLTLDGGLQMYLNLYARYRTDFSGFVAYMTSQGLPNTNSNPGPSQPWASVPRNMSLRQFATVMNH